MRARKAAAIVIFVSRTDPRREERMKQRKFRP